MAEGERRGPWAIGARTISGGSWRPTPHLTSPLEGGRDELGKGVDVGSVPSLARYPRQARVCRI